MSKKENSKAAFDKPEEEEENMFEFSGYPLYPKSWTLDTSKTIIRADFIALLPTEGKEDKFKENVCVVIQDLGDQNIDVVKYKDISEQQFKSIGDKINVIESAIVKLTVSIITTLLIHFPKAITY